MHLAKILPLLLPLLYFFGCTYQENLPTSGDAGTGIYGSIYDENDQPVKDATVLLYPPFDSGRGFTDSTTADRAIYGSRTDAEGYYIFGDLPHTRYTLVALNADKDKGLMIQNIDYAGVKLDMKIGILKAICLVTGKVETYSADRQGAFVYVPKSPFFAMTDLTGHYEISVPEGQYRLYYEQRYFNTYLNPDVSVIAGERKELPVVVLYPLSDTFPPTPDGLTLASYDTARAIATLKWRPIQNCEIKGYRLFYKNASGNWNAVDTNTLTDTLCSQAIAFQDSFKLDSMTKTYGVKAISQHDLISQNMSPALQVILPSPGFVRTLISLHNAGRDTVSVYDTVTIIASFSNPARQIQSIQWIVNSTDTMQSNFSVPAKDGSDTMVFVRGIAGGFKVYPRITDAAGTTRTDSIKVVIIQDVPQIHLLGDSIFAVNKSASFSAQASQRFGSIVRYRWDNGLSTGYDDSTGSAYSFTFPAETTVTVRVEVLDDDGNANQDSLQVYALATQHPPTLAYPANGDSIWSDDTIRWNKVSSILPSFTRYSVFVNHDSSGYVKYQDGIADTFIWLDNFKSSSIQWKVMAYYPGLDSSSWSEERTNPLRWAALKGMKYIPAGSFIDGNGNTASISKGFWMDSTEVTGREYRALMSGDIANYRGDEITGDFRPAEYIGFGAAIAFCNEKSKSKGLDAVYSSNGPLICYWDRIGYRLPTEDEWELAARGGMQLAYPTDDGTLNCNKANYFDCQINKTMEVASYPANPYGLYDMGGNLAEWCWDAYSTTGCTIDCIRGNNRVDYKGPSGQDWIGGRVIRGGSWTDSTTILQASDRREFNSCCRTPYNGLRLILNVH